MADIETFKQLVNQQYPQYKGLIDAYLSELGDVDYSDWTTEEMVNDFTAYAEYVIGDAFEECTCKDCDKEENKIEESGITDEWTDVDAANYADDFIATELQNCEDPANPSAEDVKFWLGKVLPEENVFALEDLDKMSNDVLVRVKSILDEPILESKKLKESEAVNNTITFVYNYELKYSQWDVSEDSFRSFDDSVLFKYINSVDPDEEIERMVAADFEELGPEGLAQYISDKEVDLRNSVEAIVGKFDTEKQQLFMICTLKPGVDPEDFISYEDNVEHTVEDALKDYIDGQLSDGWGEGFEQQEIEMGTAYCVYNEDDDYDCEWFADEREAMDDCNSKNDYSENYESDEDEEESASYDWCPVNVKATCSFWSRGSLLAKVLINGEDADALPVKESTELSEASQVTADEYCIQVQNQGKWFTVNQLGRPEGRPAVFNSEKEARKSKLYKKLTAKDRPVRITNNTDAE